MKIKNAFVFRSLVSITDQILISGLNFLIGAILIAHATKEIFGLYSQLFSVALLVTTLLDSIIGSALTAMCGRMKSDDRFQLIYRVIRLQFLASFLLASFASAGIYLFLYFYEISAAPFILAFSFFVYVLTLGFREYLRTSFFILSKPDLVVQVDFVFFVFTLSGVIFLLSFGIMTVENILFVLSIGNLSGLIYKLNELLNNGKKVESLSIYIKDFNNLWVLSRWAVIGSVIGWIGNNGYIYLVSGILGLIALAELNAARLILIPISIVGIAWAKVALPVFGQIIYLSEWHKLRVFTIKSIMTIEIFAFAYSMLVWKMFPWMSDNFLGEKYSDILGLVMLWALYYSLYVARNVGTTLLISYGEFKPLFYQGIVSLPILMLACIFLIPKYGLQGALGAMIIVELWDLGVNFLYMLPRAKRISTALP